MNKNYVDQENMEEMGLKEESISKKNEKNVNERHDQDGQRYEDGTSMNGNKERQENDLKRYRDGTSMKSMRKENRQKNARIPIRKTKMRYIIKRSDKKSHQVTKVIETEPLDTSCHGKNR